MWLNAGLKQELMMQEQQSIANIAFKVGASQSQFGRHFKRLTGTQTIS